MDQNQQDQKTTTPGKSDQRRTLILALASLVALGALIVLNTRTPVDVSVPTEESNTEALVAPAKNNGTSERTLSDLLASNVSQECTFVVNTEDGTESAGTVYLDGGKMRVDAQVRGTDGVLRTTSMLSDGTYYYMWGNQLEQGIQMPVAEVSTQGGTPGGQAPAVDPNQKMAYDCTPNTPPSALFTPPSDISFMNMGQMMKNIPGTAPDIEASAEQGVTEEGTFAPSASQCAVCDQAGAGRDQCRDALGCK